MMIRNYRPDTTVLGPEHEGLRLSAAEFDRAQGTDGYRFELIEGVLHVSPTPDPYAQDIAMAICKLLWAYRSPAGASAFEHVLMDPRIILSEDDESTTNPQPDLAAYASYPPKPVDSYRGVFPVLVVEVVTPDSRYKDYVRNRELYERVAAILEYWIIDPTRDRVRPTMTVHRRNDGSRPFERADVEPGGVYEPARWPGLRVDLGRISVE